MRAVAGRRRRPAAGGMGEALDLLVQRRGRHHPRRRKLNPGAGSGWVPLASPGQEERVGANAAAEPRGSRPSRRIRWGNGAGAGVSRRAPPPRPGRAPRGGQ